MSSKCLESGDLNTYSRITLINHVFGETNVDTLRRINVLDYQGFVSFVYYAVYRFFDGYPLKNDILRAHFTKRELILFKELLDCAEPNTIKEMPGISYASYCYPPPGASHCTDWQVDDVTDMMETSSID